mmetsp:Transcript_7903/g.13347  ORF Transcript_7903/g.13347 Transcript_7903/m.13347 type:complete len:574 (+) Transcript_7903:35-1756(+)
MAEIVLNVVRDTLAMFYIVPIGPDVEYSSMADVPKYVDRAIPYFLLMVTLEFVYGKSMNYKLYTLKDTIMSISLGIVQQLVSLWIKESSLIPYLFLYGHFASVRAIIYSYFPQLSMDQYHILVFIVGLLGCDLGYYWLHRTAHEWQTLWSAHSVHHSGERYNLATALRQGAFQSFYSWIFYLPLAIIGLPPTHFIRHSRLNLVYQFWVHTEIVGRLDWLSELILNTPSHHRMHHRPPGNCNYAGVFIVWDRLFGTFLSERHYLDSHPTNPDASPEAIVTAVQNHHAGFGNEGGGGGGGPRGIIYGLAQPLTDHDPVYANISHMHRQITPKGAAGIKPTYWQMFCKFIDVLPRKRVRQPFFHVVTSVEQFMPDILYDWELARQRVASGCASSDGSNKQRSFIRTWLLQWYLLRQHQWREIWALPPRVNDDARAAADAAVLAASRARASLSSPASSSASSSSPSVSSAPSKLEKLVAPAVELSARDRVFLQGRAVRDSPVKSPLLAMLVSTQFLLSLIVGYMILMHSSSGSSGSSGGEDDEDDYDGYLARANNTVFWGLMSVACVLALQTIKLYY